MLGFFIAEPMASSHGSEYTEQQILNMSFDETNNHLVVGLLGNSFVNIKTIATTVVKNGAGFLHAITINTTAAGAITVYDNTAASGTTIATLKASIGEQTLTYDATFTIGLTIVTAAASDITVSYR